MTDDDRVAFAHLMARLRVGLPNAPTISDEQTEVYFDHLRDLSIAALTQGMDAWLRRDTPWFPSIGQWRASAQGRDEHDAERAWLDLLREIRRVGYIGTPDLPAATQDTIAGLWGSWAHLCATLPGEGPELLGWAKQFKAAYGATKARAAQGQLGRGEAATVLRGLMQAVRAHTATETPTQCALRGMR